MRPAPGAAQHTCDWFKEMPINQSTVFFLSQNAVWTSPTLLRSAVEEGLAMRDYFLNTSPPILSGGIVKLVPGNFPITVVQHLSHDKWQPMIGRGPAVSATSFILFLCDCIIWHSFDHGFKNAM